MLFAHLDHLVPGRSRFRKREMVGSHEATFACHQSKVAIRLDGPHQGIAGLREAEAAQAAWREEGYRVLRFWNAEVVGQIEVVLDTIQAALRDGSEAVPSTQVSSAPRARGVNATNTDARPSP
jgi:very-short-patch-repair endonuclease